MIYLVLVCNQVQRTGSFLEYWRVRNKDTNIGPKNKNRWGEGSTKTKHLRRGVGEKYSGKEMYLIKIEMQKITNLDDVRLHTQQNYQEADKEFRLNVTNLLL